MMPRLYWFLLLSWNFFSAAGSDPSAYAPTVGVKCPSDVTFVRNFPPSNQSVHPDETAYINARSSTVSQAWKTFIGNGSQLGYDLTKFTSFPQLGIGISGGGQRAALYGAGVLESLDARNTSSVSSGTGGLMQVASYIAGLSGGSWLTSSLVFNNFPEIRSLVLGDSERPGWFLDLDLLIPGGVIVFDEQNKDYFGSVLWGVMDKAKAGLDTSITDIWARCLSYHFLAQNETTRDNFFTNETGHGAGQLWSQIPRLESFQTHSAPFPIIVIDSRQSGSNSTARPPLESTVYEVNPFEMGSYDPSLSAMTNIAYVGTHFVNGKPANESACVAGFDQAGFVIGSSSSFFNLALDGARTAIKGLDGGPAQALLNLLDRVLQEVVTRKDDVANWPNPFEGISAATYQDSNSSWLDFVDGGENMENIPLGPLLLKPRNLDVIVAVDGSADNGSGGANNFPNGTSLLATSTRLRVHLAQTHQQLPPIPASVEEMQKTGVLLRPTFFGCNPMQSPPEWPLVIYLPNAPPINGDPPVTNTDSGKLSYTTKHISIFLDQIHSLTTSGFTPRSQAPDSNFGRCLQCAAVDRGRLKTSPTIPRSDFCSTCFLQYCFDSDHPPSASDIIGRKFQFKDPDPQGVSAISNFVVKHKVPLIIGVAVVLGSLIALVTFFCLRSSRKRARTTQIKSSYNKSGEGYAMQRVYSKGDSDISRPLLAQS